MPNSVKAKIILALHAHLPYIRIPDKRFSLQELWLFQCVTECYIPLLFCFNELIEEETDFNITISLSPTLLSMLCDNYYRVKYTDYLQTLLKLSRNKLASSSDDLKQPLLEHNNRIKIISKYYKDINGNLIGELKKLSQRSSINLITTSATHALLPHFRFNDNFIQNQIKIGQLEFERLLGFTPDGFWLPEMGYYTNLDCIAYNLNIKYTFFEAHSVILSSDCPSHGNFYPFITDSGIIGFPRDLVLSNIIWSSKNGYPGNNMYREFHYDYTFSFSESELAEFEIDKIPFGLKIYKITEGNSPKKIYNFEEAKQVIKEHSNDFLNKIKERASIVSHHINRTPVFTLPFDAELFGHWWHEGPEFLKQIIKKISISKEIELISPHDIKKNLEIITPSESSWGSKGYFQSWTNEECMWIYPELADLITRFSNIKPEQKSKYSNAYYQAYKELLLASSSDWTFFISNDSSKDYGKKRLEDHISSAKTIIESLETGNIKNEFICERELLFPVFNDSIKKSEYL